MNILEMEDMVKGLPDQVLRQYAQFPDPQIPQFLALSEVQRREDMRQRFQSQQQGMEPTVKDQILQGGIASAAPQEAPPMDQGMAPPMAPQGPMGPEMGPPQGPVMAYRGGMMPYTMAEGGVVGGAKELGKAYADRVREQASTPQGLLSFVPGVGGLMAAAEQLSSLRQYFPSTPEATGFGKYFPETNKAGLSLGRVDTVRADPNLVDPESDALDREYQALISSQQNAMYAPFHSTMTGFDPTAGGTYDPGSQIMSSIDGPNIPGGMFAGGVTPGGIVRMQQGRTVPYSYESLTPAQLRKMADVLTSLGLYSTGGLDSISFNRLPIEKRQQLFKALEREGVPSQPDTSISASQNLSEQNVPLVKQGRNLRESIYLNPATTQSRYLNPPVKSEVEKEQALAEFRRVTGRDSGPEQEGLGSFLTPSPQVSPYASVFNNVPQTKSRYLNPRAKSPIERLQGLIEFKKVTGRDYSAEQAQLDELLRSQPVPESVAPEVRPPNRPFLRELDVDEPSAATTNVAPDATSTSPAPTDQGLGSMDMDPQVMDMLSKALAPQASPLEAEYEALVRSAMAEGLPPPVDLAPYAQAAETRAQTARDEAKRMAWAAALGRFGAAVAEGDIAKGIREATTDVQQGLKEGAREARTEEARAEALRLQSAESQRQATIQARQFELQSIGSLAQIAREKGASDRQAQLTATNIYADYRAQVQGNIAELRKQGALNARSFADAMQNAEKMAIDYIEALIQPTEEQKQEVLDRFRRQTLATFGYLLSEDELKKVSASFAKEKPSGETRATSGQEREPLSKYLGGG